MSKVKLDFAQDTLLGLELTEAAARELDDVLHSYHAQDITDGLLRSINTLVFFLDKGAHKVADILLILDLVMVFRRNEAQVVPDDDLPDSQAE